MDKLIRHAEIVRGNQDGRAFLAVVDGERLCRDGVRDPLGLSPAKTEAAQANGIGRRDIGLGYSDLVDSRLEIARYLRWVRPGCCPYEKKCRDQKNRVSVQRTPDAHER